MLAAIVLAGQLWVCTSELPTKYKLGRTFVRIRFEGIWIILYPMKKTDIAVLKSLPDMPKLFSIPCTLAFARLFRSR